MQTEASKHLADKPSLAHCSTHGLKFPLKSACPLCLHGLSTEFAHRPRDRRTFGGIVGLAIIGLLLAVMPMSWIEKGLQIVMPLQTLRAQNADLNLDARRYSQEIFLLEAVLYPTDKPQYFAGERIALFCEQLAVAIGTKEKAPTARIAQQRLRAFAERAQENIITNNAPGTDLESIQHDWEKVRTQIFAVKRSTPHTSSTPEATAELLTPAAPEK